ncbi:hypothetical protein SAMN04487895_104246 [Paenibacillus sophorae]|uniref:Uncharacterized protein n=1 Tax=Paenibacillus sophorae TaxID=1333845 RepID=A0A1H8LAX4_9BACL|nr:hypothetical protein [Paenibacillus sophorae]QWU17370.1 hypothetical protein KP014_09570 [Paenibacillus sophorae]SEO01858.1 hypothetical protein SAMN04487895_104246 [Paenibacillus sophorae]
MQKAGPIKYYKVSRGQVLAGLFQSNCPDMVADQINLLQREYPGIEVNEVSEKEYKELQEAAKA